MIRTSYFIGSIAAISIFAASCTVNDNAPGVEYMPDMYRSPALEAYIDYGNNKNMDKTTDMKEADGVQTVLSRKAPVGTIPYSSQSMAQYSFPYPYLNTVEDYERAGLELMKPASMLSNKTNIEKGKEIYTKMCLHCHGAEGHGDGAISKNGKIAGIPDYATKLKDLPEGKMYHTLTYGKGLMGSHASQLNQYERWQVIEYVKLLQQGNTAPEYDANGMVKVKVAEAAPAEEGAATPAAAAPTR